VHNSLDSLIHFASFVYLEQSCSNLDFFGVQRPTLADLISMQSSVLCLHFFLGRSAHFVAGTNEGKFVRIGVGPIDGYSEELSEGFTVFLNGEVEGFLDGYSEKLPEGFIDFPDDGKVEGFLDALEGCSEETPVGYSEELLEGFMVFLDGEVEGFLDGYSEKLPEGFIDFPDDGKVEGFLDALEGCSEETPVGTCDGDNESGPPDIETKTLSIFGPPLLDDAVTRTIFIPGLQDAERLLCSQSLKLGVSSKVTLPAKSPFIVTSHGRI